MYFGDPGSNRQSILTYAISLLVETLPDERYNAQRNTDGVPGRGSLRGLIQRHLQSLLVRAPKYHRAKRLAALSVETLKSHKAKIELLAQMCEIDEVWFLGSR